MTQSSYAIDQPEAFAGMKANAGFDYVESRLVEPAAGIRFGLAVKPGTDAERQIDIVDAGAAIEGITLHQHVEKALDTGIALYKQNETASVIRQGIVWMPVSGSAPAYNAAVYAMVDTGADAGYATDAAGANNVLIPTAVAKGTSTDPDGNTIVKVEINIP
jgi:hypothetical protein